MSALLSDSDLNDFINLGLACVKPVQTKTTKKNKNDELEVGVEAREPEKVSITLQDCLACAGCITSSEEIMLTKQSHTVFLDKWRELSGQKGRSLAVSIPPQCRVSLANYYYMDVAAFDRCFQNIMRSKFDAKYVVGTQIGRSICISRMNKSVQEKRASHYGSGPVLCSVCPGFVLYAEKTKPELLSRMLEVKSPQQITGNMLKQADPTCYHLSIMPCFDKKLEASRKECEDEVDCVITPREFVTMLNELSVDFKSYMTDEDLTRDLTPPGWDPQLHWLSNAGSSSGGYAYQYLLNLQGLHNDSTIVTVEGKNSDVTEYRLVSANNEVISSSSEVYGFRNIQNLVRKLPQSGAPAKARSVKVKRRGIKKDDAHASKERLVADPTKTDFVEVMACPNGCINGGGLLNDKETANRRRQLAQELSQTYAEISEVDIAPTAEQYDRTEIPFDYKFTAIESSPADVVTVGNTW